jgi:voltage-gated potassium channel
MARGRIIERRMSRFMEEPVSVRNAANVIVAATAGVVVLGGVLMWLVDHSEYPNVGRGIWWALQTVTTVGYGDVTPLHTSGRIVAAFVMLQGVAFVSILVAAITSSFVTRAQREVAGTEQQSAEERIDDHFDDLVARLDRVEAMLARLTPP